jgi:hypothetical protein
MISLLNLLANKQFNKARDNLLSLSNQHSNQQTHRKLFKALKSSSILKHFLPNPSFLCITQRCQIPKLHNSKAPKSTSKSSYEQKIWIKITHSTTTTQNSFLLSTKLYSSVPESKGKRFFITSTATTSVAIRRLEANKFSSGKIYSGKEISSNVILHSCHFLFKNNKWDFHFSSYVPLPHVVFPLKSHSKWVKRVEWKRKRIFLASAVRKECLSPERENKLSVRSHDTCVSIFRIPCIVVA